MLIVMLPTFATIVSPSDQFSLFQNSMCTSNVETAPNLLKKDVLTPSHHVDLFFHVGNCDQEASMEIESSTAVCSCNCITHILCPSGVLTHLLYTNLWNSVCWVIFAKFTFLVCQVQFDKILMLDSLKSIGGSLQNEVDLASWQCSNDNVKLAM
jgi:hypothetical protein